jgi:hypothetical protein
MSYHYTKIDDLILNDKPLYFRTPLTDKFTRATTFSEKYLYYHSPTILDNNSKIEPVLLGKFVKVSRRSSGCPYYEYNYSVYEFQLGTVDCSPDGKTDGHIYLVGIPDSNEGMVAVDLLFYNSWHVFIKMLKC